MSIAYTIQKLFWCFPNQFLLILDWVQAISNFLREKNAETWDNSIFWGKLFTIHRKGCDLVKISWAFAVNLPEFLHRDSWKPPIRWTPLFTAECVWLTDVFDHLILLTFWSWYVLFRSNLFFSFNRYVTQLVELKIIMYKKCSLHWNFFKLDLSAKIWSTEPYMGSAIFYTVCSTTNRLSIMHRYVYARSLGWCNPHTIPTYRYIKVDN